MTLTESAGLAPGHEPHPLEHTLEEHRRELGGYCYRMLGSAFESDDAVQETMLRAWRNLDSFAGRSSLRTWLFSIATRVCLDMLEGRKRRARPMEIGPRRPAEGPLGDVLDDSTWLTPVPESHVLPGDGDPAEVAVLRESIRLAFVHALQQLPPRQRAVLILREVLQWKAAEVAELLDDSVASVNSALQRARATLAARPADLLSVSEPDDERQRELVARFADAFERYDMDSLVSVLHEEVTLSMPPYEIWLRGVPDVLGWLVGHGAGCRGSRLVPVEASGSPAFGQYRPSGPDGSFQPWALQVLETDGERVTGLNSFLDTDRLFPLFGLPPTLPT